MHEWPLHNSANLSSCLDLNITTTGSWLPPVRSTQSERLFTKLNHNYPATYSTPLFITSWTLACQAPLSMGFSRQEYCMGYHSLLPGSSWLKNRTRVSRNVGRFFIIWTTREAPFYSLDIHNKSRYTSEEPSPWNTENVYQVFLHIFGLNSIDYSIRFIILGNLFSHIQFFEVLLCSVLTI